MYHKRKFVPKNPEKYTGDPTNIIMRSSWETKFANWCDNSPHVVKWLSEETVIPYVCPTDNRVHRYFPDFYIKVKENNGKIKKYIIENKEKEKKSVPHVMELNTNQITIYLFLAHKKFMIQFKI